MSDGSLFSVKMRASRGSEHVSGAERIVPSSAAPRTAAALVTRALTHSKGMPDFINVKLERPSSIVRLKSLPVTTHATRTPEEGMTLAAELLAKDGIGRVAEIMAKFAETYVLRGAMLLDADTLERLDPNPGRGVRATFPRRTISPRQSSSPPKCRTHLASSLRYASPTTPTTQQAMWPRAHLATIASQTSRNTDRRLADAYSSIAGHVQTSPKPSASSNSKPS